MKTKTSSLTHRLARLSIQIMLLALILGATNSGQAAISGSWSGNYNGNWSTATNWSSNPNIPSSAGDTASLTFNLTSSGKTVTLDSSQTVGVLNIGDTTSTYYAFTLSTNGSTAGLSLTFDNSGNNAQINKTTVASSASDIVSVPLVLNSSLDIKNSSTAFGTLTIQTGGITAGTSGTKTISNISDGNSNVIISAVISDGAAGNGPVAVVQNSANSTLTLSGANTFTGGLTIKNGTVSGTTSSSALGGNGTGTVYLGYNGGSANATLAGDGRTFSNPIVVPSGDSGTMTIESYSGATVFSGGIVLTNNLSLNSQSTDLNISGAITGTNQITSDSASGSYVNLSGSNPSFSGNVLIDSGVLRLGNASALNSNNKVALNTGAMFDVYFTGTIAGLSDGIGTGIVTNRDNANHTLTLGGSGSYNYSGTIVNGANGGVRTLSLVMDGLGTQTFFGNNTYTGTTTVNSGTLLVNGNDAAANGAVTVTGGILGGSGTIGGAVNVYGGTLVPGGVGSIGTLTLTNGLALGVNSASPKLLNIFTFDLVNTNIPGTTYDQIIINSGSKLTQNPAGAQYIQLNAITGTITNGTYTLMTYPAGLTNVGTAALPYITFPNGKTNVTIGTTQLILTNGPTSLVLYVSADTTLTNFLTWQGATNSTWDINAVKNWFNGVTQTYADGDFVTFDDTARSFTVTNYIGSSGLNPSGVLFNNNFNNYLVGATINNPTNVSFYGSGQVTVTGTINGTAALTLNGGGNVLLSGTNTYTNGVDINNGTLELANNQSGVTGSILDTTSVGIVGTGVIIDSNAVVVVGSGNQIKIGYDGIGGNNSLMNVYGFVTNNGALNVYRVGTTTLFSGSSWLQNGAMLVRGYGNVNANMAVNPGATFTYAGTSSILLNGSVSGGNNSVATLTVAGLFNTGTNFAQTVAGIAANGGGVVDLNGGTLQLSTSVPTLFTAVAGQEALTTTGASTIDVQSYNTTITNGITGTGSLTKLGTGTLTLSGANTYSGNTTISAGTLTLSSAGSINNSSLIAIAAGTSLDVSAKVSTYTLSTNLNASGAALPATINGPAGGTVSLGSLPINLILDGVTTHPALSVSNATALNVNGNSITISNASAIALSPGTYHLIQLGDGTGTGITGTTPVLNGSITGAGSAGSTNYIAANSGYVDLVVSSGMATTPTNLSYTVSSGVLNLTWPADHKGWLVQSNFLDLSNTNDWHDISGTDIGTNYSITMDPAQANMFYRLHKP